MVIICGISRLAYTSKYNYKAHKLHKYILTFSSSYISEVFAYFIITNMDLPMNMLATCLSQRKKEEEKKERKKASNVPMVILHPPKKKEKRNDSSVQDHPATW